MHSITFDSWIAAELRGQRTLSQLLCRLSKTLLLKRRKMRSVTSRKAASESAPRITIRPEKTWLKLHHALSNWTNDLSWCLRPAPNGGA
jgi:hypothetical protein